MAQTPKTARLRLRSRDAVSWRIAAAAAWAIFFATALIPDLGGNSNSHAFSAWLWCVGAVAGTLTLVSLISPVLSIEVAGGVLSIRKFGVVRAASREILASDIELIYLPSERRLGGACSVRARTMFGEEFDLYRCFSSAAAVEAVEVLTKLGVSSKKPKDANYQRGEGRGLREG